MNLPEVDFTRIRPLSPAGQRAGFEQFLCQIVAQLPPSADAAFFSLHGDGGDGGVECFWAFPNSTEHGFQAKFWTDPGSVDKSQLDKSVDSALTQHPDLTHYTIAIPTDPTGKTAGPGKSLHEKIYDTDGWLDGWKKKATDRGLSVEFKILWKTELIDLLEQVDSTGIQRRYWFDADVLPDQWWNDRLDEAVATARPRYMPDLSIEVPAAQAIAALCSDEEWWDIIGQHGADITRSLEAVRRSEDEVLAADLDAAIAAGEAVNAVIASWRDSRDAAERGRLLGVLEVARDTVTAQAETEASALTAKHGDSWDSEGWRQWQREMQVSFPAAAVDALRETFGALADLTETMTGPRGRLAGQQFAVMTGAAGTGKTYVAIDSVKRRLAHGRPSVLVHGRWFGSGDPLIQLRDCLHLPSDLTGEETLALLAQAGNVAGTTVLLTLDALNDTRPRSMWRDQLDRLAAAVSRHPNLRLLLTARTHYVSQLVPTGFPAEMYEHTGFEGVEFEAVSEYADHYGLEPPTSPPIHGEFDNPLYLRLVCEALQTGGRLSLDQATMGLGELVTLVLGNVNEVVSDRLDAPPQDQIVQKAMRTLAGAIADSGDAWLSRSDAQEAVAPIWADRTAEKSLLDSLIGHGLLEEDVRPDGTDYGEDIITVTFERLMHHLIVLGALEGTTDPAAAAANLGSGRLRGLLRLGTPGLDRGLLEATSVVIAERFGVELTEYAVEIGNNAALYGAVVAGTAWRNDASITQATRDTFSAALMNSATAWDAITMLFRLSARPDHPLNGDHLHDLLASLNMGPRDAFLVPWMHESHGTGGAVDRLIRWARERPIGAVGPETTRLWATALLWCTSATDRRVTDPATVGAARLLRRHPNLCAGLLRTFLQVDDDAVVQRACEVAYTALLSAGSKEDWAGAADAVWTAVFSGQVPTHAGIRDAGRSILDAAAARQALPAGVSPTDYLPPYASDWPIEWPSVADVADYDTERYPKLAYSVTHDDFFIYRLSTALDDFVGIDLEAAARRVLFDVVELGYDPGLHARFDSMVVHTYGGGRGKPAWIERIGKKYQWIALARLIGVVADHAPRTRRRWDPPAPTVPGPHNDRLRQMDPTVLGSLPATGHRPWVESYAWQRVMNSTDVDWVADESDLPNIAVTDATHDARPFVVLTGHYEWSGTGGAEGRRRQIWTQLTPLLVKTADLAVAMSELEGKSHAGEYRRPMLYHGFIGEYPYGHHNREDIRIYQHEKDHPLSVEVDHATFDLLGEYEYAPQELARVSLEAPAPVMFGNEPGSLAWNGATGWVDETGQIVAVVRDTRGGMHNELLMDSAWLEQWLNATGMSLIWIAVTGKDAYRDDHRNFPGRLMRTVVKHWTPGGSVQAATPAYDRSPPSS